MNSLKRDTIIGTVFVVTVGCLAHFIYDWSGNNPVIGLFVPVSESVWEHMKLLFFPMLLYSPLMVFRHRTEFPCIVSALCLGIVAGTLLIPVLFYAYTYVLGRDVLILDIATFLLSVIAAFRLAYKHAVSYKGMPHTLLGGILVGILFTCFVIFTHHPPDAAIFQAFPPGVSQPREPLI